jgi:hypothetical protein
MEEKCINFYVFGVYQTNFFFTIAYVASLHRKQLWVKIWPKQYLPNVSFYRYSLDPCLPSFWLDQKHQIGVAPADC